MNSVTFEKIKNLSANMENPESDISNEVLLKYIEYTETHDSRFPTIHNMLYIQGFISDLIKNGMFQNFGVAFFNLRNFSVINHKLGPQKGNELIEKFFNLLQDIVTQKSKKEEIGVVAAAGGDNGTIVFHKQDLPKILTILSGTDFNVTLKDGSTEKVTIAAKAGINMDPSEFSSPYDALDSVLLAMNTSRRVFGKNITFYDDVIRKQVENQHQVEAWYKAALKNEEFEVYYQPKVDLKTYRLKGAEALVRWFHDGKMIYPDTFIPVLEQNNSIKYLDMYMLNHVCMSMAKWIREGKDVVQVSVNLSRASLSMQNIVTVITSTIDKYQIPRSLIQIELTESASGCSNEELKPVVFELNAEGISTAMDDFGTGYSSLSLIKELPWDMLKIDKSLLQGAQKDGSNDQKMFKSIIDMATNIGLECIVEGVETRDDIRLLKESNCWLAQGYYFSKPIPTSEFEKLL